MSVPPSPEIIVISTNHHHHQKGPAQRTPEIRPLFQVKECKECNYIFWLWCRSKSLIDHHQTDNYPRGTFCLLHTVMCPTWHAKVLSSPKITPLKLRALKREIYESYLHCVQSIKRATFSRWKVNIFICFNAHQGKLVITSTSDLSVCTQ